MTTQIQCISEIPPDSIEPGEDALAYIIDQKVMIGEMSSGAVAAKAAKATIEDFRYSHIGLVPRSHAGDK